MAGRFLLWILCVMSLHTYGQPMELQEDIDLSSIKVDSQYVDVLNERAFRSIASDPVAAKDDVVIAYNKATEIGYQKGMARSLTVMGGIYWNSGNYQQALSHYLDALKEYQKLDDTIGRSMVLNNIGEVYKKLGEYDNALDYLQHSASLKENIGIAPPLTYNNIAEIYVYREEYDKAQEFFNKAFQLAFKAGDERVLAYISDGVGAMQLKRNNFEAAIPHFEDAVGVRFELNDMRGLAYSYNNMGRAFFGLGQYDSAQFYYQQALEAARNGGAEDVEMRVYRQLSQLDSLRGDYIGAYAFYLQHDRLKDNLFNKEKSAQIARMEAEYENELLKSDNEMREAELEQRNTFIIMVTMLLIFSLAIVWILYNQRSQQQEANKELHEKNEYIAQQNSEIQSQAVKLKKLNDNLENLNVNLEDKIRLRTEMLEKRNVALANYAFIHAHELRAPVANILGLVELLKHSQLPEESAEIVRHLHTATSQLDEVICKIAEKEQEGSFI